MTHTDKITRAKTTDLQPDLINANRHTGRGVKMVHDSIEVDGFRFAGTVDKNNRIVHGNNRHEQATDVGLDDVIIIDADPHKQYYLRFADLDLTDPDNRARILAYQANRSAQVSIDFDSERVLADLNAGVDLGQFWSENEISKILEQLYGSREPTEAANNPNAEWSGMPEYENEDVFGAVLSIKVHFAGMEDVKKFARLVEQNITKKTTFIWYPKQQHENLMQYRAIDES